MSIVEFDIEKDANFDKILLKLYKLKGVFDKPEFKEFIRDKVLAEMNTIVKIKTSGFGSGEEHSVFLAKVNEYKNNNKSKIESDYILIYNDTVLTQDEMTWVKEETRANYPNGLSISYLIEYGSGLLGDAQPDWPVNVNGHNGSWSYIGPDEMIHHTSGIKGRYIYLKTLEIVKRNFSSWVDEFMNKEVK